MDRNVSELFKMIVHLINHSVLMTLVFLPLLIAHFLEALEGKDILESESCGSAFRVPCSLLYASFQPEEAFAFTTTMIAFLLISVLLFMYEWVQYDKFAKLNKYFGNRKYPLASLFFDAWDWRLDKPDDLENVSITLFQNLNEHIYRDELLEQTKSQSLTDKLPTYALRLFSYLFNLGLLWGLCLLTSRLHSEHPTLMSWCHSHTSSSLLCSLLPTATLSFLHLLHARLIALLTTAESYDFSETRL